MDQSSPSDEVTLKYRCFHDFYHNHILHDEVTQINAAMSNPTADWERVGDKFYRKTQLYTSVFDQDLELENYIVVGCAYGGAVGMLTVYL